MTSKVQEQEEYVIVSGVQSGEYGEVSLYINTTTGFVALRHRSDHIGREFFISPYEQGVDQSGKRFFNYPAPGFSPPTAEDGAPSSFNRGEFCAAVDQHYFSIARQLAGARDKEILTVEQAISADVFVMNISLGLLPEELVVNESRVETPDVTNSPVGTSVETPAVEVEGLSRTLPPLSSE